MALTGKGNEWSKIHNSIAEVVGSTALVRFSKIPGDYGLNCNLCKFFSANDENIFLLQKSKTNLSIFFQTGNVNSSTRAVRFKIELHRN